MISAQSVKTFDFAITHCDSGVVNTYHMNSRFYDSRAGIVFDSSDQVLYATYAEIKSRVKVNDLVLRTCLERVSTFTSREVGGEERQLNLEAVLRDIYLSQAPSDMRMHIAQVLISRGEYRDIISVQGIGAANVFQVGMEEIIPLISYPYLIGGLPVGLASPIYQSTTNFGEITYSFRTENPVNQAPLIIGGHEINQIAIKDLITNGELPNTSEGILKRIVQRLRSARPFTVAVIL